MQITKINTLIFAAFTLSASVSAAFEDVQEKLTCHPSWELNKSFYTQDYAELSILGSTPSFQPEQWEKWGENVPLLPYHKKVTSILLNHGSINRELARYLCKFENIEELTLGIDIEGILMSEQTFKLFHKMKKLKYLNIAIHGFNDSYFKDMSKFESLESIVMQFPDKNMIIENEMHLWSKTYLSNFSFNEISKLKSLRNLYISVSSKEYVKVEFSFDSVEKILKLPNLEHLHLATTDFVSRKGNLILIYDFNKK